MIGWNRKQQKGYDWGSYLYDLEMLSYGLWNSHGKCYVHGREL